MIRLVSVAHMGARPYGCTPCVCRGRKCKNIANISPRNRRTRSAWRCPQKKPRNITASELIIYFRGLNVKIYTNLPRVAVPLFEKACEEVNYTVKDVQN